MKIVIVKNYQEMSKMAADIIENQIKSKPNSILGLATGGTPEGMYKKLVENYVETNLDWSRVKSFNLDEYIGIDEDHPLSYKTYMHEHLFNYVNVSSKNVKFPLTKGDLEAEGKEYDNLIIKSGGIDLQILGIGQNAHIAFNEPGSLDSEGTREVELTDSTIKANSRYFDSINDVPKTAMTMGIETILKAKKIILLASGENKAQAIKDTVESMISSNYPASYLQKHNDVTLIVDEEAASLLKK